MQRSIEHIAILAALMSTNCENRIEVMRAFELGLITVEERDREFERLDNIVIVVNAELLGPSEKFCNVSGESLIVENPARVGKNQLN